MKTDYQYEYCDLITIQINETETFENIVSVPLKENSEFVQLGEYFAINKNAISTIDNIFDKGYKVVICTNVNRKYCYVCSPDGLSSADSLRLKKRSIKRLLIEYKGGKCEKCGYCKCDAALQFHHKNPEEKDFAISTINLNTETIAMSDLYKEVDKCSLLCANCHAEEHYNMTV